MLVIHVGRAARDGGLWFYTSTHADLWENIGAMPEVNVSFSQPDDSLYVSVSGTAQRVVDREQIKAMWNPMVQAWFPAGPDDPHVVLVRVDPLYFRPAEVETLLGDPSKAARELGWVPEVTIDELIEEMVDADLQLAKRSALLKRHGFDVPLSLEA